MQSFLPQSTQSPRSLRFAARSRNTSKAPSTPQIPAAQKQQLEKCLEQHRTLSDKRTETKPTPFKSIGKFFTLLGVSIGLVGAASTGGVRLNHYFQVKPQGEAAQVESGMQVKQDLVGKPWQELKTWADGVKAQTTTYNVDTATLMEFQTRSQNLVKGLAGALGQSGDPQDFLIAQKISFDSTENDALIDQLGVDLFTHVGQQVAKGEGLAIDQFINTHTAFDHLPSKAKEKLGMEIFTLFNQNPNLDLKLFQKDAVAQNRAETADTKRAPKVASTDQRILRDTLEVYVGNKINGLSFDKLTEIKTSADVLAYLKPIAENKNNFKQLTDAERTRFIEQSKEILKVLDFQFQDPGSRYFYESLALLLAGGLGAAALGVVYTKRMGAAIRAKLANRNNVLNTPLQIVKTASAEFSTLDRQNDQQVETLKEIRKKACDGLPEVKAFFSELDKDPAPYGGTLIAYYENIAQAGFAKQGKTQVTDLELAKAVQGLLNLALAQHNYLPEFQLYQMICDTQKQETPKATTPDELLAQEIASVEEKLGNLQIMIINQQITVFHLNEELQAKRTETAGTDLNGNPLAQKKLQALETNLKSHQSVLEEYHTMFTSLSTLRQQYDILGQAQTSSESVSNRHAELERLKKEAFGESAALGRLQDEVELQQQMVTNTQADMEAQRRLAQQAEAVIQNQPAAH